MNDLTFMQNKDVVFSLFEFYKEKGFKKLSKEQIKQLNEPFPDEALKPYQGSGNLELTSIDAQWIMERLNNVFGTGNWYIVHDVVKEENVKTLRKNKVTKKYEETDVFTVVVRASLIVPEYGILITQYGSSMHRLGMPLGDVYKSALTDATTKCASYLGIGSDVFKGLRSHKKNNDIDEIEIDIDSI